VATSVAELVAYLRADTTQFTAGMEKAAAETRGLTNSTSKAARGMTTAFAVVGVAAVAGIAKAVEATVEWAGEVRQLQRVTGESAESASALAAAGAELGVTVTKMNVGFGLLSKNIVNGAAGFEKYGINVRDAQGNLLPFDTVLGNVADRFVKLPPGVQQAAFAMNVFGRSGKELIPLLSKGSAGIDELKAKAKEMGLVLSQDDVDAARALAIAQRDLSESFKGVEITIGREFIPAATKFLDWLSSVVQVASKVPGPVYQAAGSFLALTGVAALLIKAGQGIASTWGTVAASMGIGTAAIEAQTVAMGEATAAGTLLIANAQGIVVAEQEVAAAAGTAGAAGAGGAAAASGGAGLAARFLPAAAVVYAGVKSVTAARDEFQAFKEGNYDKAFNVVTGAMRLFGLGVPQSMDASTEAAKKAQEQFDATHSSITDLLSVHPEALGALAAGATKWSGAIAHFGDVSGQSTDSIIQNLNALESNAKATGVDVVAVLASMKQAWSAWHDQLVSDFGGAGAALDDFMGKTNVSFNALNTSLAEQKQRLATWRKDFDLIGKSKAASQFLQDMSAKGLDSIGVLESVAAQPKKIRDEFLRNYNDVNSKTSSLATDIQRTLDPAFERIIFQLKNIIRAIRGLPRLQPKVDLRQWNAAVAQMRHDMATIVPGGDIVGGAARPGSAPPNRPGGLRVTTNVNLDRTRVSNQLDRTSVTTGG
jgi:hypothetical protein